MKTAIDKLKEMASRDECGTQLARDKGYIYLVNKYVMIRIKSEDESVKTFRELLYEADKIESMRSLFHAVTQPYVSEYCTTKSELQNTIKEAGGKDLMVFQVHENELQATAYVSSAKYDNQRGLNVRLLDMALKLLRKNDFIKLHLPAKTNQAWFISSDSVIALIMPFKLNNGGYNENDY
jgi:hypothetical protein